MTIFGVHVETVVENPHQTDVNSLLSVASREPAFHLPLWGAIGVIGGAQA